MNAQDVNRIPIAPPPPESSESDKPTRFSPATGGRSGEAPKGPAKVMAGVLSLLLLGAVAWPVNENFQDKPRDDFPFSYYPMFTNDRGEAMSVNHLVGITADGREIPVSYHRAGDGGFNQVRRQINRYVREDNTRELIEHVADDLAASTRRAEVEVEQVQIVRSRFRFDDYFAGNKRPVEREVVNSAPVDRSRRQEEARQKVLTKLAEERAAKQGEQMVQGSATGGRP